jgi:hypothetical protein
VSPRERAGLVEGDGVDARRGLDVFAALEQDALPAPGRDRREDRRWRRDDDRTRRGGDHERHRPVERPRELAPEGDRNRDGRDGEREHAEDVRLFETVDEALRRRFLALGLFDHVDEAGDRRLVGPPRDLDFEAPALVYRAAEHLVAGFLRHGDGLAGQGGLVDRPLAGRDDAVERDSVAGADDEHVADGDVVDGDGDFLAVAQDLRFVRAHLDEGLDGPSRATDGVVLERVRQREQEQEHRALERGPDGERAECGDDHQQVDVDRAVAERLDGPLEPVPTAERVRDAVAGPPEEFRSVEPPRRQAGHHAHQRQADERALPSEFRARSHLVGRRVGLLPNRDATAADGLSQQVLGGDAAVVGDPHAPRSEGDVDAVDARCVAEVPFECSRPRFATTAPGKAR